MQFKIVCTEVGSAGLVVETIKAADRDTAAGKVAILMLGCLSDYLPDGDPDTDPETWGRPRFCLEEPDGTQSPSFEVTYMPDEEGVWVRWAWV